MRLIGHLADEPAARTFGDYLYVQGIENQVEHHPDEGWAIWIHDEDKIQRAASLLEDFRQNPADTKYQAQGKSATALRAKEEKSQAAYRQKLLDRRHLFQSLRAYGFGPLTFVLIMLSIVVAIVSRLGAEPRPIMNLFISDYTLSGHFLEWNTSLPEICHGQIWRLITPIFIHFGTWHILFNLLWLHDLGSMIEGRQSSGRLAVLVLVIGACSNLAQFYYRGPMFGGMSGVVYGLLGYVWIRGKFDPGSGLYLHPTTVIMMILWFLACFTPLVPNVANAVHTVGFGMGIAWGYLSSLRYR